MNARNHIAVRGIALVASLLWVAVPVASALHSSDHAHTYCEQHQAIEEGSRGASAEHGDGVSAEEAHERCAFDAITLRAAIVVAGPSVWDVSPAERPSVAGGASATHQAIAVLMLAPKSSPPAS